MRLLRCFSLDVFVLLTILSLIDASAIPAADESAPEEKSCLDYCSNNGICIMTGNDPKCYCLPGWMGARCNDIRKLTANPGSYSSKSARLSPRANRCPTPLQDVCQNGGTCYLINGNELICVCPDEFLGELCEIESNCPASYCENGGTCIPNTNPNIPPTCECLPQFTGFNCKNDVTTTTTSTTTSALEVCKFLPNFCKNGGTCYFDTTVKCRCPPTYTGPTCSISTGAVSTQGTGSTVPGQTTLSTAPAQTTLSTAPAQTTLSTAPAQTTLSTAPAQTTLSTAPGQTTLSTARPQTNPPAAGITCANRPCQNNRPCYPNGNSYFCHCGPQYRGTNCEISNSG